MSSEGLGCLRYRLEQPDAPSRYVFDFVFDLLGLSAEEASSGPCSLYYGDPGRAPAGAVVIPHRETDVEWPEASGSIPGAGAPHTLFPFDAVNVIRRLLFDDVNRGASGEAYDEHQRLRFVSSLQGRTGAGECPVVNSHAIALGSWLRGHVQASTVPAWPDGRQCAIGLSHDVDRVARRSRTLFWPPYATYLSKYENLMVARQRLWHLRQIARHPRLDDVALFRRLMRFEADSGCSSTFFFATRNRFGPHGSLLDVQYDAGARSVRGLMHDLRREGFGIGLHASYRAFEDPARFVEERRRLADLAGSYVAGLRHHFWHLGSDPDATMAAHEAAGFSYDSSLAFNEHLGFRRSVAWPYYPWSHALQRPLRTVQLPVFCMDGNVFYGSNSVDAGIEAILTIVAKIKEVGGLGVIDWHSDSANPATPEYRHWGQAYEQLVRTIADDSAVWTTSLEAIVEWFTSRRRRLAQTAPRQP